MDAKEKKGHYQRIVSALCRRLISNNKEKCLRTYYRTLDKLKPNPNEIIAEFGDAVLAEKIKRSLVMSNASHHICKFEELFCRLKSSTYLKNREAVLVFLWQLGSLNSVRTWQAVAPGANLPNLFHNVPLRPPTAPVLPQPPSAVCTSQSVPSLETWQPCSRDSVARTTTASLSAVSLDTGRGAVQQGETVRTAGGDVVPLAHPPLLLQPSTALVAERTLLHELLFSLQGIPGSVLKLDPASGAFKLDPQVHLSRPVKRMVMRLTELGWLHNRLKRFCHETEHSRSLGLMQKSLVSAVREHLTEYYRFVAVVQMQVQMESEQRAVAVDSPLEEAAGGGGSLTLRQLGVWALEPTARLRCLVGVVEAGSGRRGGELASAIFGFLQHGDPVVRSTVSHLLTTVCKPLYLMLSRWVVDGELEDRYGEFFIAADAQVKGERLWHDKYCVKPHLVPSFIPLAEANKILATGKSINFLREVCHDHTPVRGRDVLRRTLDAGNVEALFKPDHDGDLQQVMDAAYREASRRVLDVLSVSHKFLENLHALRRYLLLGQGDFIRHLMEIVNSELSKPASQLHVHNLWGMLDTAVRATNAQFEAPDILQRLDVRLLEQNPGDTGWDVFTLDYHVTGPLSTIFAPSAGTYLMLFHALWRNKRMEYVLAETWKQQATAMRSLQRVQEAVPALRRVHLLTAEMIHLVQQMQYYTLFEVIECAWHEMLGGLARAESLDGILHAHSCFLNKVRVGALLDEESAPLAVQVRAMYGLALQLARLAAQLRERTAQALAARDARDAHADAHGACLDTDARHAAAARDFAHHFLPHVNTKLRVLTATYQGMVKQFLLDLAAHPNASLQLLSFRLDFNDHYKRRDARLAAPYTYQHRRVSELGAARSPAK